MASIATPPPAAPAPVSPTSTPAPAAPASPASASPAGDLTMDQVLADVLAQPAPASPPTATGDEPAAAPQSPEAAAAPAPTTETAPQPDLDEKISGPDSQSDKGEWTFTKAKGQRLVAAQDMLNQMREAVPNLTIDTFKEMAGRANAANVLMGLYHQSVNPNSTVPEQIQAMEDVVGYFGEQSPQAFGLMAIRAHMKLPEINPEAAKAINNFHTNRILGDARSRIAAIQDPAKRNEEVAFVQNLEMRLTGRFTPAEALLSGAKPPDPVQAQMAEVQKGRQEIQEWQRQQQQQKAQQFEATLGNTQETAIMEEVGRALEPVKSRYSPEAFDFLCQRLRHGIAEAEAAHPEWGETYQGLYTRARTTGSPDDIRRLADYRRQIAQRVIRLNGPKIVSAFTSIATNGAPKPPNPPPNEPAPNGVGTPAAPNGVDAALKAMDWKDMSKAMGWS